MFRTRILVVLLLTAGLIVAAPSSVQGAPSDTGVSTANFTESEGCGVRGPHRPEVSHTGYLNAWDQIYGPWGDFFGRNRAQISAAQRVWYIPMTSSFPKIHERAWPAVQLADQAIRDNAALGQVYRIYNAAAWVYRTIGGSLRISEHAFGTAIDINSASNPYSRDNVLRTDMPQWFVDLFSDAGFCWGGYWVTVKDAMHFSWNGPAQTPGYPGRPAPYPPLTSPSQFDLLGWQGSTVIDGSLPGVFGMADFSGDGSADLFSIVGGRLLAAGSQSEFTTIGARESLPSGLAKAVLVGDHTGDGRPDLIAVDASGSNAVLHVLSNAGGYDTIEQTLATAVQPAPDHDYALTLYDDDYLLDLVVFSRSGSTRAAIWTGASGYTEKVVDIDLGIGDTTDTGRWSLLAGDHDVDGVTDFYAVDKGSAAIVHVISPSGEHATITTGQAIPAGAHVLISDYDGDGRDDLYLLEGRSLTVLIGGRRGAAENLAAWYETDSFVPWDAGPECVGPGPCAQIGYVDGIGLWRLADRPATDSGDIEFFYGVPGDAPFAGDWDCDGDDTPGLHRESDGYVYLRNANTQGIADREFFFGNPGDVPLVGDFDGDGCDTVSLYRPSEQRFYIMNRLGEGAAGLGQADFSFVFGNPGDKPFTGDFDGDGVDEVGLHRESTGLVYMRWTLSDGSADNQFIYGDPGDVLVAADWNGDGVDTVAVYRPSEGNWYLKLSNSLGVADHAVHYHAHGATTRPVAGYFATSSGEGD